MLAGVSAFYHGKAGITLSKANSFYVRRDGTKTLTANWDTGAFLILTGGIQARSGQVLVLNQADGTEAMRFSGGEIIVKDQVQVNDDVSFTLGSANNAALIWDTAQATEPALVLGLSSSGNTLIITDKDRIATDFTIGAATAPHVWFHDGSATTGNRTSLAHNTNNHFRINNNAGQQVQLFVGGTGIFHADGGGVDVRTTAGSTPTDNTEGLDSMKLGFESTQWSGSAAVTRTCWLRFADKSGTDDLGELTISSDDLGGSENDFLIFSRSSASVAGIRAGTSHQLRFLNGANSLIAFISATASAFTFLDDAAVEFGSGSDYRFEYDTAQTNNGLILGTQGAEGNYLLITDKSLIGSDFSIATQTNPTLIIHDGGTADTDYTTLNQSGTVFQVGSPSGGRIDLKIGGSTRLQLSSNDAELFNNFGSHLGIHQLSEEHNLAAAATSDTTIAIPAGAIVLGVSIRVTTAVTTSSATNTFDVGDDGAADPNRYGADIAGAANTTNAQGPADNQFFYASATNIRFDAAGAETFTAGVIRVHIYYMLPIAATS